jgi:hypothetical protein
MGTCKYAPEQSAVIWSIKQFPGGKEFFMKAHFNLPSVEGEEAEARPPIQVKFEIPYFTTSGIQVGADLAGAPAWRGSKRPSRVSPQVRYLKIIEKSGYQALPWVRYITTNGGASPVTAAASWMTHKSRLAVVGDRLPNPYHVGGTIGTHRMAHRRQRMSLETAGVGRARPWLLSGTTLQYGQGPPPSAAMLLSTLLAIGVGFVSFSVFFSGLWNLPAFGPLGPREGDEHFARLGDQ